MKERYNKRLHQYSITAAHSECKLVVQYIGQRLTFKFYSKSQYKLNGTSNISSSHVSKLRYTGIHGTGFRLSDGDVFQNINMNGIDKFSNQFFTMRNCGDANPLDQFVAVLHWKVHHIE